MASGLRVPNYSLAMDVAYKIILNDFEPYSTMDEKRIFFYEGGLTAEPERLEKTGYFYGSVNVNCSKLKKMRQKEAVHSLAQLIIDGFEKKVAQT